MQGTVVAYAVEVGERVGIGQTVAVLEAMKMENTVAAQREGIVVELGPPPGAVVEAGAMLARIDAPDS